MKLKFNIVALSHNDVADHFLEYARTVEGKYLNLVPDNENPYDPMAVKAYDGKIFLGYVAAQDSEDVRALLLASGKKALRTKCTGYGSKEDGKSGLYLKAETRVWLDDEEECWSANTDNKPANIGDEPANTDDEPANTDDKPANTDDAQANGDEAVGELEVCGGRIAILSANGKPLPMPESLRAAYGKIFNDQDLERWQYTGPVFSIDSLSRIDDCTTILEGVLEDYVSIAIRIRHIAQSEAQQAKARRAQLEDELSMLETEVNEQLETFMQNHRYDFSREMGQTRKHIQSLLLRTANERLLARREELLADLGYLSSSGCREAAARNIFIDTPKSIKQKHTGTYDYSDRLDEIEHQLEQFPMDIYRKFKADPVDFFREIFYKRIPRKQMKQFLSGIILMIMNGRVGDAQRWGKHDDQEALQEMKAIGGTMQGCAQAKLLRQIVDACIEPMASYKKRGQYAMLIKAQSDWYPVYRLLGDLGIVPKDSPQAFCKYLAERYKYEPGKVKHCKREDLKQAAKQSVFEETDAKDWHSIAQEKLKNVQSSKFDRYCDIIDAFQSLMRKEADRREVSLEELIG